MRFFEPCPSDVRLSSPFPQAKFQGVPAQVSTENLLEVLKGMVASTGYVQLSLFTITLVKKARAV